MKLTFYFSISYIYKNGRICCLRWANRDNWTISVLKIIRKLVHILIIFTVNLFLIEKGTIEVSFTIFQFEFSFSRQLWSKSNERTYIFSRYVPKFWSFVSEKRRLGLKCDIELFDLLFFFIQNVPIAICFVISHSKLGIRREISNFFISAIWFFLLDYKDKRFSNCFKHFNSHFCNTIL